MWLCNSDLFDLSHAPVAGVFSAEGSPLDALSLGDDFWESLGDILPKDEYQEIAPHVFVAKDAKIAPTAYLGEYTVIGAGTEVRHCAYIRGKALVGRGCVVGNSTELKNAILFDGVQVPHYNYVGDSILGYRAHMGAGSIASNVRADKMPISMQSPEGKVPSGRKKLGALLGDFAEVGCNAVLCPGTVVERGGVVYPLARVRGTVPANCIYKAEGVIVPRRLGEEK